MSNFQTGDHGYSETMELLAKSNPSMLPCLRYEDCLLTEWHRDLRPPSPIPEGSPPVVLPQEEREPQPQPEPVQDASAPGHTTMGGDDALPLELEPEAGIMPVATLDEPVTSGEPSLWPLQKLLARARHEATTRAAAASSGSAAELAPTAVLLMTGALNPVHNGHLASLEFARQACEAQGVVVLGGFLSPSHDSYVGPKMARKVRCLPMHHPFYTHKRAPCVN